MTIKTISTEKEIKELYDNSYSTILGAGGDLQEWVDGITNWMKENNFGEMSNIVTFKGKDVNDLYNLEGDNRFKDDLTILAWSNDKIDMGRYCIPRMQMGIRWFDDIIDNSLARQGE